MIFAIEIDPRGVNTLTNVHLMDWPLWISTWKLRVVERWMPLQLAWTSRQRPLAEGFARSRIV